MLRHAAQKGGKKRNDGWITHFSSVSTARNGPVHEMVGENGEDGATGNLSMQGDDAMRRGYCWVVHWRRKE